MKIILFTLATALLSVNAFDISTETLGQKQQLCLTQTAQCSNLCNPGLTSSSPNYMAPTKNTCDSTSLHYDCICAGGNSIILPIQSFTIEISQCQGELQECISNCLKNLTGERNMCVNNCNLIGCGTASSKQQKTFYTPERGTNTTKPNSGENLKTGTGLILGVLSILPFL
jgi:hypothetical protein